MTCAMHQLGCQCLHVNALLASKCGSCASEALRSLHQVLGHLLQICTACRLSKYMQHVKSSTQASVALQAQHVNERTVSSSVSTAMPRHKADSASRGSSPSLPSPHKAAVPPPQASPPSLTSQPEKPNSASVVRYSSDATRGTPADSFPGFAQSAAKHSGDAAREVHASKMGTGKGLKTLLFPPAPSQEPLLRPPAGSGDRSK